MEIHAIRHTRKEVYLQIDRTKEFTRTLTQLARLLKIDPDFHFEEEFQVLKNNAESYTSASSRSNKIQVVVSRDRVHIVINANLETRKQAITMVEQFAEGWYSPNTQRQVGNV